MLCCFSQTAPYKTSIISLHSPGNLRLNFSGKHYKIFSTRKCKHFGCLQNLIFGKLCRIHSALIQIVTYIFDTVKYDRQIILKELFCLLRCLCHFFIKQLQLFV